MKRRWRMRSEMIYCRIAARCDFRVPIGFRIGGFRNAGPGFRSAGAWLQERGAGLQERGAWLPERWAWLRERGASLRNARAWLQERGAGLQERRGLSPRDKPIYATGGAFMPLYLLSHSYLWVERSAEEAVATPDP